MVPFQKLSEELQQKITYGEFLEVLPTIAELSKHYNVGVSTVKRSINRLKEYNYVQGMQGKCVKANPLALGNPLFRKNVVIYIRLRTLRNPFYQKVFDLLWADLEKVSCFIHVFNCLGQFKNCGFIPDVVIVPEIADRSEELEIEKYCPPERVIKLNRNDPGYCCIGTDNTAAGYMAMDYLYRQCGHRAIGIISTQLEYSYGVSRLRYDGAMNFQREHKDMELFNYELKDLNNGQEAAAFLLKKHPKITAIFATMDLMAVGVYGYCYSMDLKIPEDISILGFDDREFSVSLYPRLSTYKENVDEIFHLIYKQIENIIRGNGSLKPKMIKPNLVIRESVKEIDNKARRAF